MRRLVDKYPNGYRQETSGNREAECAGSQVHELATPGTSADNKGTFGSRFSISQLTSWLVGLCKD